MKLQYQASHRSISENRLYRMSFTALELLIKFECNEAEIGANT